MGRRDGKKLHLSAGRPNKMARKLQYVKRKLMENIQIYDLHAVGGLTVGRNSDYKIMHFFVPSLQLPRLQLHIHIW